MMHTFGDHRLHAHGDRLFIKTRLCAHGERLICRPTIMLAFLRTGDDAYLRRPPTTHAWRAPLHRPAIGYHTGDHIGLPHFLIHIAPHFQYLDFCSSKTTVMHNFGYHRLLGHGDRRFIDRRSCWSSTFPHSANEFTHL